MPAPLPLPIRVAVKGASTVGWTSWMGGPPSDLAFPRCIQAELHRLGRPADVRANTVAAEQTRTLLSTWEREFIGWSPDVVVLAYGHYEAIHLFLPHWLERHANSMKARPGRWRSRYRKLVLRPTWVSLAKLQARLDRVVPARARLARLRRAAADLEQLIRQVQQLGSPLIFVIELQPPAVRGQPWFPGMAARIALMNTELRGMVDRIGAPNVRWFSTSELIEQHAAGDVDTATPDGFHYTPQMHAAIGTELGRRIAEWADEQPHLRLPQA